MGGLDVVRAFFMVGERERESMHDHLITILLLFPACWMSACVRACFFSYFRLRERECCLLLLELKEVYYCMHWVVLWLYDEKRWIIKPSFSFLMLLGEMLNVLLWMKKGERGREHYWESRMWVCLCFFLCLLRKWDSVSSVSWNKQHNVVFISCVLSF